MNDFPVLAEKMKKLGQRQNKTFQRPNGMASVFAVICDIARLIEGVDKPFGTNMGNRYFLQSIVVYEFLPESFSYVKYASSSSV